MSAHPFTQRAEHKRWFRDSYGNIHTVEAGRLPEEGGVDTRSALEVPEPPQGCYQWIGPKRGWVKSLKRTERAARRARFDAMDPGDLLAMIEELEARVTALEAGGPARVLAL